MKKYFLYLYVIEAPAIYAIRIPEFLAHGKIAPKRPRTLKIKRFIFHDTFL